MTLSPYVMVFKSFFPFTSDVYILCLEIVPLSKLVSCFNKLVLMLSGLTIQANMYYKMLISWTSQKIKETYFTHNAFEFKNGM